jgi:Zn-dependent protease
VYWGAGVTVRQWMGVRVAGTYGLTRRERLAVYISGPGACLVLAAWAAGTSILSHTGVSWLDTLALTAVWLGLLSLLPVFPLPGARVLHLLLAARLGYLRALAFFPGKKGDTMAAFCRMMDGKAAAPHARFLPVRYINAAADFPIEKALRRIPSDGFVVFLLPHEIGEDAVMQHVLAHGTGGVLGDIKGSS